MPILSAEPQLFPELLFEQDRQSQGARRWWVLHAKPRQEKSLARDLFTRNIPYYLPTVSKRLLVRNRPMTSRLPLFPGYVFLLGDPEERVAALATKRVVHPLHVDDQTRLWDDLRQVHRLITTGAPITPEDRLEPGVKVEIKSGPLAGMKGTIIEKASRRRFVVQVDFIQRGASLYLDDFVLAQVTE